jgi:Ca2+-transporting ATPase
VPQTLSGRPVATLALGPGPPGVMERPPRDRAEPVLTRRHWGAILGYGGLIAATVLLSLSLALGWLGLSVPRAISVSFLTLAFARLWHVFNMREPGTGLVRNDIVANPFVWGALGFCSLLLLSAVYVPGLSEVLTLHGPGWRGWGLALGASLVPLVIGQLLKQVGAR